MSEQIDVIAHIHAKPGQEDAVRAVLESYVGPTRQEDGCLRYDLFVDVSDPTRFTFVEEWTTMAALEKHGQSAHIAAGRAQLADKVAEAAWVQKLHRVL
ncbi:MAG: antibiotic biosynthesis monooxygenase [Bryobacteraceae bacterium]|nr:antibiotic biosynthesis monooxygenase [Bryobacteraceae bacterium]